MPCFVVDVIHRFLISFQIIDPHDSGIADSILQNLIPDERVWNPGTLLSSSDCINRTQELTQAYFEYISGLQTEYAKSHGMNWTVSFSRILLEIGAYQHP